jgi:hypothetical protein
VNNRNYDMKVQNSADLTGPYMRLSSGGKFQYFDTGAHNLSPSTSYAANTWYSVRMGDVDAVTHTYDIFVGLQASPPPAAKNTGRSFNNTTIANVSRIQFISVVANAETVFIDEVKVRQYAASEPTNGAIGAKE